MTNSQKIAVELTALNPDKYNQIIERASLNGYHDFKFDSIPGHAEYGDCTCPKSQLFQDLMFYPELGRLAERVLQGEFDDIPDKEDNLMTSLVLLNDGAPEVMFEMLGLNKPVDGIIKNSKFN